MKQKIEWYREVLELEPGSRVFFPLAKLLAADGQTHDAIITLRQGVLRHPDHVEARLLLVELLSEQGSPSDLAAEVERLGTLLSGYPGFWSAWSEILSKNPTMRDVSLAIRFLAAALRGKPLTWAAIIEHGLEALLSGQDSPHPAERLAARQEEPAVDAFAPVDSVPPSPESVFEEAAEADFPTAEGESIAVASKDAFPQPAVSGQESSDSEDEEDESEETFSLRTRSMAEVLAEQGDLSGALDIYQELIVMASPEEKISLEARADELSRRMKAGPSPDEARVEKASSPGEGNRLVALLDTLAQRLEARAR